MTNFKLTKKGDIFVVEGPIDEHAHFGIIKSTYRASVNFSKATCITSRGAVRLLELMMSPDRPRLIFQECPTFLIDALVMIPGLMGTDFGEPASIESLFATYDCDNCHEWRNTLVQRADLDLVDGEVVFPTQTCAACGATVSAAPYVAECTSLFLRDFHRESLNSR